MVSKKKKEQHVASSDINSPKRQNFELDHYLNGSNSEMFLTVGPISAASCPIYLK